MHSDIGTFPSSKDRFRTEGPRSSGVAREGSMSSRETCSCLASFVAEGSAESAQHELVKSRTNLWATDPSVGVRLEGRVAVEKRAAMRVVVFRECEVHRA